MFKRLCSILAVSVAFTANAFAEDVTFPVGVNTANCYGDPINNQTSGTVTYAAQWEQCDCTEGANVADCTITGVTDNACNYSFNCERGYTYNNQTSGRGTGEVNEYIVTTPDCSGRGQYVITLNPNRIAVSEDVNGTPRLYTVYDQGVYLDSDRTQLMSDIANHIDGPTRKGYNFTGYFRDRIDSGKCPASSGYGYIGDDKYITSYGDVAGKGYTTDETWYACWNPKKYNITYHYGSCQSVTGTDGEWTDVDALTFDSGYTIRNINDANISAEIEVPTGYTFQGWTPNSSSMYASNRYGADSNYAPGSHDTLWTTDGNLDLYAVCNANTYTIQYFVDGESDNSAGNPTSYNVNTSSTRLNDPTRNNYEFSGWYECTRDNQPDITTEQVEFIPGRFAENPKNLKLCGVFNRRSWTITYIGCYNGDCINGINLNNTPGVTGLAGKTSYTYGDTVTFPTANEMYIPHYEFNGVWFKYSNLSGVVHGVTSTTTGNITVYTNLTDVCCTNNTYLLEEGNCGRCPLHSHVVYNENDCGIGCECDENYQENPTTGVCEPKSFYITLDPNRESGSTGNNGTGYLYTIYTQGVYLDANGQQMMSISGNGITQPTSNGHKFGGYFASSNTPNGQCGNGTGQTKLIADSGFITSLGITTGTGYTSSQTWYACWNYYNVSYLPGSCGGKPGGDVLNTSTYNVASTLQAASTEQLIAPAGYHFVGWATSQEDADAGIVYYTPGATLYTDWQVDGDQNLYAVCLPDAYDVNYYCDENQLTPVYVDSPYYSGNTVTLLENSWCSSNDSVFVGWFCNERPPVYQPNDSFVMPSHNVDCFARWNPCEVCNPGEGCDCDLSVVNNECTYATSAQQWYTLVSGGGTPNPQCSPVPFNIIYQGGVAYNPGNPTSPTHTPTQTMPNTPVNYGETNVALRANGFSITGYHPRTPLWLGDYNAVSGMHVGTTYVDQDVISLYNMHNDLVLEARWDPNPWKIHYFTGTAGSRTVGFTGTMADTDVTYDADVLLRANAFGITGYTFSGWRGDYSNTTGSATPIYAPYQSGGTAYTDQQNLNPYQIDNDLNLYAQWKPNKYDIIYHRGSCSGEQRYYTDEGVLIYDDMYSVSGLSDVGFSEPQGYQFLGWSVTSGGTAVNYVPGTQYGPWTTDGDLVLYAVCGRRKYRITYDGGYAGGTHVTQVAMTSQSVDYNTDVQLKPNTYALPGWTPTGWVCETENEQNLLFEDGAWIRPYLYPSDMDCEMQWEQDLYHVDYDCNGADGGTVPTDDTGYHYGDFVTTQNATCTKTGYTFNKWDCEGVLVNAGDDFRITEDTTCVAQWDINRYDVVYNYGTCSVPRNANGIYTDTNALTFGNSYIIRGLDDGIGQQIIESNGYEFLGWTVYDSGCENADCVDYEPLDSTGVWTDNSGLNLYAVCALKEYTITYDHRGNLPSIVAEIGHFEEDADPLEAYTIYTPDEDTFDSFHDGYYVFDGWYDNLAFSGSEYELVPGSNLRANPHDITLHAKWLDAGEIVYDCDVGEGLDNIIISYKRAIGSNVNTPTSDMCGIDVCEIDYWICDTNHDGEYDLEHDDITYEPDALMQVTERDRPLWCKAVQTCANVPYPITYIVHTVNPEDGTVDEVNTVKFHGVNTLVENLTPNTYTLASPVSYPAISTISLDGYSFEGWFDTFENGVFSNPTTQTPTEEPGGPITVHGKMVANRVCEIRYHNVEGATYPNGTNPSTYVVGAPTSTPIAVLHNPAKGYYRFKGWHFGSADGDVVNNITYAMGAKCGVDLYAEWEFICNEKGHEHWLHIGDGVNDKVCLYEKRQTNETPAVRVKRSNSNAEPYYLMLSEDSGKKMHEGSNKKMRIDHTNRLYNICDRSTCPELLEIP